MRMEQAALYAKNFIGMKYWWGGEGPHDGGFDCSGLVLECLRSVGLWGSNDSSAKGIFTAFVGKGTLVDVARPGDLLFFGKSRTEITHVAFALSDWQMVEAGGGDQQNNRGMVRIRPISWRKDLVAVLRINQ